jgi:hypothetical protein
MMFQDCVRSILVMGGGSGGFLAAITLKRDGAAEISAMEVASKNVPASSDCIVEFGTSYRDIGQRPTLVHAVRVETST